MVLTLCLEINIMQDMMHMMIMEMMKAVLICGKGTR